MRVRVQKFFLLASVSCVFFYLAGCVPITPPITKTSASSTRDSAYQPFVFPFDLPNSYEGKTFSSRLLIAIPTPGVIRDATAKFYGTNYHDHLKNVEKIHKRLMTRAEAIKNFFTFFKFSNP